MKQKTKTLLTLILCILIIAPAAAQKKDREKKNISLEDIWLFGSFYPKGIYGINSTNNGEHYTILENNQIIKYNYIDGTKDSEILSENALVPEGENKAISISSYEFSPDENMILISSDVEQIYRHSTRSKNYIYHPESETLIPVANGQKQRLAEFSPDNSMLAYVRDNNLFMYDIENNKEKQITFDGKFNAIINGAPDWVYEEEFSFAKGFFWSPDSRKIAYYKFDESRVKEFTLLMYEELYPETYTFKYPKAGEDNSIVSIYVYHIDTDSSVLMETGENTDQYIPRITWTQDTDKLCITRLNRMQNRLHLLICDARSGKSKTIFTETNNTYVDIHDNLTFLKDKKHYIWTSEKDGYNHIYLHHIEMEEAITQITKGPWEVTEVLGIDENKKLVYYISNEVSSLNRDLYSVSFDGEKKSRLTKEDGSHNIHWNANFTYYIDNYSTANQPNQYSLYDVEGNRIRILEDNSELLKKMEEYSFIEKEFFTIKNREGTELNAWIIKPVSMKKKKKYPVLMYVYGGPGSNTVQNIYAYSDLWYQYLVQKGYIIVSVDNRGTGSKGEEFKKATYLQLGKLETEDQIDAAKYLQGLDYVDPERIAIWGWSYGGYMSSLCILKGADVFKSAIAVAPVSNWRYYDNIYTERFMRKPEENEEGYDKNSPIHFVKNLNGNYLIIHGAGDDNVHFQNTMEMVKALNDANKQFDMHIYPNKNHGIYGGYTRLHLYTKMSNYLFDKN